MSMILLIHYHINMTSYEIKMILFVVSNDYSISSVSHLKTVALLCLALALALCFGFLHRLCFYPSDFGILSKYLKHCYRKLVDRKYIRTILINR